MKKADASEQIKKLMEGISGKEYTQKYMYAVSYLKNLIKAYDSRCVEKHGSSPVQMVDFRIKSAESIAHKLEKKGYGVSFVNAERYLNDLAGIRVVCFSEEDVYEMDRFFCECEEITIVKRKDYIKLPKANGYRSLHLIAEIDCPVQEIEQCAAAGNTSPGEKVRVEIQIRTRSMHCWAEADHRLCYKNR